MNSVVNALQSQAAMVQADGLRFGYPGLLLADTASHVWPAGLCLIQGDEATGKSSWLKTLAGQLKPQAGALSYRFAADGRLPAHELYWQDPRQILSEAQSRVLVADWVAQQPLLYPHWSAPEMARHVQGFGLEVHWHKPLLALSSGSLRKLWLAAGWASGAALTLLDEPLAALDLASERYVLQALAQMADSLKDAARPRSVIVAHWDAMQGIDWDDVLALAPR
ncbi:ABC transporter ATP-binding protein [Comamonas sp.]|uniref:ABC transporter ATP-binding protein n=1 Tax=Comamonas sp. TaxID=34028 RepID=UPI003A924C54